MNPHFGLGLLVMALAWFSKQERKEFKMPAVQQQFEDFHSRIKLEDDNEKAKLREKRETLIEALKNNLGDDVPTFTNFNQGSYSMHTGVVPLDGNYDIDVGVVFDCKRDKYPDPVVLKKEVRDALDTHGRKVDIRRPCVTINYMRGDRVDYHVDLAIYVKRDDGLLDLAKGKEHSEAGKRIWEVSDPRELTRLICTAFTNDGELAQYRRCIRYIKRWRDVQFSSGAPLSIAMTVAARSWFRPHLEASGKPGDLTALLNWVDAILEEFHWTLTDDGLVERLKVMLPVTPNSDLMGWMTQAQMDVFKSKLKSLRDALQEAADADLPEESCRVLNAQFGDDFRIPDKATTARPVSAPVIGTGNSA